MSQTMRPAMEGMHRLPASWETRKKKRKKMSSSTREELTAAVLTVSDSSFRGDRSDASGPAVSELLQNNKFAVTATKIVPDEQSEIQKAIVELSAKARLITTTGGSGIAPRDVTPEATRAVCERLVDGIPERM